MNLRNATLRIRKAGDSEAGFTLIELLVVMLILGILAAIALPAFFNQKGKAADAKTKEYAHSAQVAMETCGTENSGEYTNCTEAKLKTIEPTLGSASFEKVEGGSNTYTITLKSKPTTQTFSVKRLSTGAVEFPCTVKATGGCPEVASAGNWAGG